MPIYSYICEDCNKESEYICPYEDRPETIECHYCGEKSKLIPGLTANMNKTWQKLSGAGFYSRQDQISDYGGTFDPKEVPPDMPALPETERQIVDEGVNVWTGKHTDGTPIAPGTDPQYASSDLED